MRNRPSLDERWLRRRYVTDRASLAAIAAEAGCSPETIRRHLRRSGVELRSNPGHTRTAGGNWGVDGPRLVELVAMHGWRGAACELGTTLGNIMPLAESLGVRAQASQAAVRRRSERAAVSVVGPLAVDAAKRAVGNATGVHREALQARIDHPEATLSTLAGSLGWNPNTYAVRLRRALAAHDHEVTR